MIDNPYPLVSTKAAAWCDGFVLGLTGPSRSSDAPESVAAEDVDAFNVGILAGSRPPWTASVRPTRGCRRPRNRARQRT
jgi:hypothetical protein